MTKEKIITLPHTVTLSKEVTVGNKVITQIEFVREPTAGSLGKLPIMTEHQNIEHFFPVIAAMTDHPTVVIERLSFKDFQKCLAVTLPFTQDSEIGDTILD